MRRSALGRRPVIFWVLLLLVLTVVCFPLYWLLVTSLKTPTENISASPVLLPGSLYLRNFADVIKNGFFGNLLNTLSVALSATLLSLTLAFLAGYALSRHRFPFRFNALFLIWVLAVKILPPVVLVVPLYTLFAAAHLLNSLPGLVLVYQVYTLPYCIWMLFGFFKTLPREFEQAARIDGAGELRILGSIVLPLMGSAIVATAIFSIILAWDEFLFALLFIRAPHLQTLPLLIVNFITEYQTLWGELTAVGILATLPLLLFSGYVYRQMTEGFNLGLK